MSVLSKLAAKAIKSIIADEVETLAAKKVAKRAAPAVKSVAAKKPLAAKPTQNKPAKKANKSAPETKTTAKVAATPKAAKTPPAQTAEAKSAKSLAGTSLVSTRRPNEKSFAVQGNPDEVLLTQTGEGMRGDQRAFGKNMALLTEEPFMADMAGAGADRIYEAGVRRGADNLKFIAEELMDPKTAEASVEWYPTANRLGRDFAARIGKAPEAGWAGLAATSPQTPWPTNVARVDRMTQMMGDNFAVDPAGLNKFLAAQMAMKAEKQLAPVRMGEDYVRRIAESNFDELSDPMDLYSRIVMADKSRFEPTVLNILPDGTLGDAYGAMTWGNSRDLTNALRMMQDPSVENIRRTLTGGGKVPSFYDDIADPVGAEDIITADTHSTGATSLFPAGATDTVAMRGMGSGMTNAATGSKGYYGLISDAHNVAKKELGVPRGNAVQSITWEGVRDLWGSNAKTDKLKEDIARIWREAPSPDAARFSVAERMGRPVRRMFSVKAP